MPNITQSKRTSVGVMLSLAVLGLVSQATAQSYNFKTFPSSMCVSSSDVSYSASQAYLSGGSAGYLFCPVVKDTVGSDTYNQTLYVSMYDTNTSFDIYCTFYIHGVTGSTLDWDSDNTTGSSGAQTLSMQTQTGGSSFDNPMNLQCQFTTGGSSLRMRSYRFYEYGTLD